MFKKKRGIDLPYSKQGLICFTCLDYKEQPSAIQDKILNLCLNIGREYYQALFEVMTTERSIVEISLNHHVSESVLYRLRKEFYERWGS